MCVCGCVWGGEVGEVTFSLVPGGFYLFFV